MRLIAVLALTLAAFSACEKRQADKPVSKGTTSPAKIVRVVDGDTIKVSVGGVEKSVRLIGIDTPESHKPGVKVECGAREASANLTRLAPAGARAYLTTDPTQDKVDRYGRLLAYVSVNHKRLQLEQLYDGWAEVYVYQGHPFRKVDDYRSAQGVAQRAGHGVWQLCSGDFHSQQHDSG